MILFRKSKKYGNYTNQKKNSHRNQYTCSGDLIKVRRKIEKKGNFSIIVCQEKLCDYAIKSQKFCAEEQKEALHQRANGIYMYVYMYKRLVIQCRTNIWL